MLKFTLVVSWIFSVLMAETIWVCFSGGGAAAAEVAALPVVVCDLAPAAPLVSAFMLPLLSRPSAFMSLAPLVWVSELMLFDFSPLGDCVPCALLPDGAFFSLDSAPFMPVLPLSRFIVPDAAPPDGAVCCVAAPPDAPSRFVPVPCAFAKPVPAIRAATAAEIKKRLVISISPHVSALPAPTTKGDGRCSS